MNAPEFLERQFGAGIEVDLAPGDFTVGITAVILAKPNGRRVRVRLSNFGGGIVALGIDQGVTATTGTPLAPGETIEFTCLEDFSEPTRQIIGISAVAGNAVHVVETVLTGSSDAAKL